MKQFATLTVIGRDRTGVVAAITRFLFEQRANIEALEEQVTRGQFSMTLQASWPRIWPPRARALTKFTSPQKRRTSLRADANRPRNSCSTPAMSSASAWKTATLWETR